MKRYIPLLLAGGLIGLVFLALWLTKTDPRLEELTQQLATHPELTDYPYHFRVLDIKDGTATVTSPRTAQVSVLRFLAIIHPELAQKDPDSPEVIQAQKALAQTQSKASKLLKQQPDISEIHWMIDKKWYLEHGQDVTG